ncbi:MAG: biotin transporter BioY [Eubacterium sp.]
MREKKFLTIQDMVLIAVFAALISVCSLIQIPFGPVPFTLQTFAVFTTAGLLGTKRGTISVIIYILLGLIGVPVFAGASSGPGVIAGPTGGYITGFVLTAIIIGIIMKWFRNSQVWLNLTMTVVAMIVGDIACLFVGTIQFMIVMKTSLIVALGYCVIPFIIPDLVKIIVATIIVNRVKKYVRIFY